MTIATLAEAPRFDNAGFVFRPLAVPSRGSAELAVWSLEASPGAESEPHSVDREEVFVVHAGELLATIDGEEFRPGPGDALVVAPGREFRLRNPGREAARVTVCTSKGIRGTIGDRTIDPPWAR